MILLAAAAQATHNGDAHIHLEQVLALIGAAIPGISALVGGIVLFVRLQEKQKTLEAVVHQLMEEMRGTVKELKELVKEEKQVRDTKCNLHESVLTEIRTRLASIAARMEVLHSRSREG